MWPPIVRNLVLPAHEALLRRPTFAVLDGIAAESGESSADVAQYQSERMAALVAHAREAVPYWRGGDKGAGDGSEQDLLPVTTRAQIRRHRELMRWPEAPGKLIIHSSSGTTDDNLIFYLDRRRQAWSRALRMRALQRLGIDPGEKQLHFWPRFGSGGPLGSLKDAVRVARDRLTNDPVFDLRPMTAARLDEALAFLDRYRPAVIVGYPSWLFALAQHQLRSSSRRKVAAPRFILSTGELLYEFQRQAIESAFGARVVEEYGSQDVGLIASEDDAGTWQVNWEHVVVEVLRDGRPARAGETGEVIVTNLHSHVMPFIRYATGDVVTMPADLQPRPTPGMTVLPRIEGRTSDLLVSLEGRTAVEQGCRRHARARNEHYRVQPAPDGSGSCAVHDDQGARLCRPGGSSDRTAPGDARPVATRRLDGRQRVPSAQERQTPLRVQPGRPGTARA